MTAAPTPPQIPPGKIVQVALIDAVLIGAGVALYFFTDDVIWSILAVVASGAVMIGLVILPQVRAQIEAEKKKKGGGLVE